ncbi:MAG TPA: helix-turn-helix transcriptional regulator [Acidimicrobiia bacterium]
MSLGVQRGLRVGAGLGAALRARRAAMGMSEARVAMALRVRLSEVRAWERGDSVPDAATVRGLARLLGLDSTTGLGWLEMAGVDVGTTSGEREVSILLLAGDAPADPFRDPAVVVDLTPRRPSTPVRRPQALPHPAVSIPSVFPEPGNEVYVYSTSPAEPIQRVRQIDRRRRLVTTIALVGLGILLWWAFGQLGNGLATVVDRLSGPAGLIVWP